MTRSTYDNEYASFFLAVGFILKGVAVYILFALILPALGRVLHLDAKYLGAALVLFFLSAVAFAAARD